MMQKDYQLIYGWVDEGRKEPIKSGIKLMMLKVRKIWQLKIIFGYSINRNNFFYEKEKKFV